MKSVVFLGDSLDVIRSLPAGARREVGFQIERLQRGLNPDDWKPLKTIGPAVREIRVRAASGAFRVIYVAVFADALFILHAFQKKTATTSKRDISLAKTRYRDLRQRVRG
jgi:phage-related protein